MSVPTCGVCHEQDSKYKCPICELRYCSLNCYKSHKTSNSEQEATIIQQRQQAKRDRPGTTHRGPKLDFSGFEDDADFKRLLSRYPSLKPQLQLAYGLTLEPGPDEKWTWNRQPLLGSLQQDSSSRPQRGRGRGGYDRGRGRGMRGGRGGRGGFNSAPEERQHGPWTQDKGDKEALLAIKKLRTGGEDDESAEGMREFSELCQIKFGKEREGV